MIAMKSRAKGNLTRTVLISIAVCFASISVSAPPPTETEKKETARQYLQKGIYAFQSGDHFQAAQYYQRSVESWPSVRAIANLCNLFLYGYGVEQNHDKALKLCSIAAGADDPHALVMIGEMSLYGLGRPRDRESALSYYRRAAELGHPHGKFMTGLILIEEPSTFNDGQVWLVRAQKAGHKSAAEHLEKTGEP